MTYPGTPHLTGSELPLDTKRIRYVRTTQVTTYIPGERGRDGSSRRVPDCSTVPAHGIRIQASVSGAVVC